MTPTNARRLPGGHPFSPAADLQQPLSDGEIHFLWHFIQGSIMIPETRLRLRRAWGMCPRHGAGAVAVEAAFRHNFLHGPAVLYEDLMDRALAAMHMRGPLAPARIAYRLREAGLCLMCDLGYGPASRGAAPPDLVEQGRDLSQIRAFAGASIRHWSRDVCGRCAGDGAKPRCRRHLRADLGRGAANLGEQRALVGRIAERVQRYARAFRWEHRGTDTPEDRAALISAVGWCSGWAPWLFLFRWDGKRG